MIGIEVNVAVVRPCDFNARL